MGAGSDKGPGTKLVVCFFWGPKSQPVSPPADIRCLGSNEGERVDWATLMLLKLRFWVQAQLPRPCPYHVLLTSTLSPTVVTLCSPAESSLPNPPL